MKVRVLKDFRHSLCNQSSLIRIEKNHSKVQKSQNIFFISTN